MAETCEYELIQVVKNTMYTKISQKLKIQTSRQMQKRGEGSYSATNKDDRTH